jgi:ribosomal protein L12E/L44/L45/RPP1/RPP2
MAIQPIDLQILFTQLEKVGKAQAFQKDGTLIQQAIQSVEQQRRTDENIRSVNEAQDTGRGTEEISDRNAHRRQAGEEEAGSREEKEEEEERAGVPVFKDPSLGKYVDFTG